MNAKKCDRCGAYYTKFNRDILVVDKNFHYTRMKAL